MNNYERLTDKKYLNKPNCFNCEYNYLNCPTCERRCVDGNCFELREELQRLADLEDKIEDGTLIELGKPYIRQLSMIPQQDKYIICKATERVIAGAFTKAEVEAKLKELQGE